MLKSQAISPTLFLLTLFMLLSGCFKAPPQKTLSQAHGEFLRICKEEYKISPILESVGKTTWIYLPLTSPNSILHIKASKQKTFKSKLLSHRQTIRYIDVQFEFENKNFSIEYDIGTEKFYPESHGYNSDYTGEYHKKFNDILTALFRAYADLKTVSGDRLPLDPIKEETHRTLVKNYIETEDASTFFVIVISDIVTGVETVSLIYFEDYKRRMAGALSDDEFVKRLISETQGDQDIIGDTAGEHVSYHEITMPEFLSRQIAHRINFKYNTSSSRPSENAMDEIQKIVAETVDAYEFKKFESLILRDIGSGSTSTIGKLGLEKYLEK